MTETNKRGFILHAFGHGKIDYVKIAVCCALSIKTNLKINDVTLITDEETNGWMEHSIPADIIEKSFDKIIIIEEKFKSKRRQHFDSPWNTFTTLFHNQSRSLSYLYSPYDETILIDTDYIMMNDSFDYVWGNYEDVLINKKAVDLKNVSFGSQDEKTLGKHGIPMYWATAVYFKKSEFAETFFNLIDYIKQEYKFFQFLYGFLPGFYRNDFAFSIAVHIMNGYIIDRGIKSFPLDTIVTAYQQDTIADILSPTEMIFYSHNVDEPWKNTLVRMEETNVHIMNKIDLIRNAEKFINICLEKL